MLTLNIKDIEFWDEALEEFITVKGEKLQLEHSLVSISKWESKWGKPFLTKNVKSDEEFRDYIRFMACSPVNDDRIFEVLGNDEIVKINAYIDASMTATTVRHSNDSKKNNQVITNELIYYWMIALGIPFECQYWHLNRLLTLIDVCSAKNTKEKPRSSKDVAAEYSRINSERLKRYKTKG